MLDALTGSVEKLFYVCKATDNEDRDCMAQEVYREMLFQVECIHLEKQFGDFDKNHE